VKGECRRFGDAIQLYLDGRLTGEEGRFFEGHVGGCQSCRAELDAFSTLFRGLGEIPLDEPPAGFNASVLRRISLGERRLVQVSGIWVGIRWVVVLGLFSTALLIPGLYLVLTSFGRVTQVLSDALMGGVEALGWLTEAIVHAMTGLIPSAGYVPIFHSLAMMSSMLLHVAEAILSDPLIIAVIASMAAIGVLSLPVMAKLMGPVYRGVEVNGHDASMGG